MNRVSSIDEIASGQGHTRLINGFSADEIRTFADKLEESGLIGVLDFGIVTNAPDASVKLDTKPMFELISACMRLAADSLSIAEPLTMVPHKSGTELPHDSIMDIYSLAGTKIVFTGQNGYDRERENAREILTVGGTYTVESTRVGAWTSEVFLKEVHGHAFNTVMFNRA